MMRIILVAMVLMVSSCSTIYYNTWEFFGREKRDILAAKMEDAADSQEDAKEQFKDSLEVIREQYNFKNDELADVYDELSDDYESFKKRSDDLKNRISRAREVADDLFDEWKDEAYSFTNKSYRRQSLNKRKVTMKKFYETANAMSGIQQKMEKVLSRYHEHVLFLKHNLNAKVIGQLKVEMKNIMGDVENLIKDIQYSQKKTTDFISDLERA
ncbi:MAG: DNA repair protein [Halobacteriovoraceae bacterium]|nr:DNA repair protein [Halobacteriovoraceae bacterium]|tara:strand:+ start:40902 stop:41540 length:639 start_codon:yes stop_codon:yes gene_type:complete